MSENDPGDVTRLWDNVLGPIGRRLGCGVIVTDHDAKSGAESRYGRGSGAKLAAVEIGFKVIQEIPFTRDQDGLLRFEVSKDRPGCLHRAWKIRVTRDPLTLHWEKTRPTGVAQLAAGADPGGAVGSLAGVLNGVPATIKDLVDRIVAGHGIPLRTDTCRKALAQLYDAGIADKIDQGAGHPVKWFRRDTAPDPGPLPPEPDTLAWPAGSAGEAAQ